MEDGKVNDCIDDGPFVYTSPIHYHDCGLCRAQPAFPFHSLLLYLFSKYVCGWQALPSPAAREGEADRSHYDRIVLTLDIYRREVKTR